ncbi:unnamed protein product [Prorocentrum cordatum]|uniref:Exostosin GT47 domain-containing protein n=1 Tax=Prorocentrum cordatum TaxID=2364126 RepID=A0ABN9SDD6_9DINO|nr:unnamed protein product [Polarella glacialis]
MVLRAVLCCGSRGCSLRQCAGLTFKAATALCTLQAVVRSISLVSFDPFTLEAGPDEAPLGPGGAPNKGAGRQHGGLDQAAAAAGASEPDGAAALGGSGAEAANDRAEGAQAALGPGAGEPGTAAADSGSPVPLFSISPAAERKGHQFHAKEFREIFVDPLKRHPSLRQDNESQFSFMCCFRSDHKDPTREWLLGNLSARTPERPYLVFVHGLSLDDKPHSNPYKKLILERDDFLYLHFDLRGYRPYTDHIARFPGITVAPPVFFEGPAPNLDVVPPYTLTFRGSLRMRNSMGPNHPRRMIAEVAKHLTDRADVAIEWLNKSLPDWKQGGDRLVQKSDRERYMELMNTKFVLMLRGVDRWSYRFSEAIGACAIPVLISHSPKFGLTLPYEELINWSQHVIVLSQILGKKNEADTLRKLNQTPRLLVDSLPSDPETIQTMRRKICALNDEFFSTAKKRAEATLRAAAIRASLPRWPNGQNGANGIVEEPTETKVPQTNTHLVDCAGT